MPYSIWIWVYLLAISQVVQAIILAVLMIGMGNLRRDLADHRRVRHQQLGQHPEYWRWEAPGRPWGEDQ